MVTSCEVAVFGDVSFEAPPRGASDVVTGPVEDPAAVADREVAVGMTSGGVAGTRHPPGGCAAHRL